jgi:putative SOS response-associated peptidase YedK
MAPGQSFPLLYCDRKGMRSLSVMKWGLVPRFLPPGTKHDHFQMFNARIETVESKPSFRNLVKNQRCVVMLNGFFEWKSMALGKKQPHYICRRDGEPLKIACVYEVRDGDDEGGEPLVTFSMVTRPSGVDLQSIHDREPVFLSDSEVEQWIDNSSPPPPHLLQLPSATYHTESSQTLVHFPVNSRVTSMGYQEEDVCVPVKPPASIVSFFAAKPQAATAAAEVKEVLEGREEEEEQPATSRHDMPAGRSSGHHFPSAPSRGQKRGVAVVETRDRSSSSSSQKKKPRGASKNTVAAVSITSNITSNGRSPQKRMDSFVGAKKHV